MPCLHPAQKFRLHVRITRGRQYCRQPVLARDNLIAYLSGLYVSGPPNNTWHAEATFPSRGLLAMEGSHTAIGPEHDFRAVIGRVNHDRVVGDPEIVKLL